MTDRKFNLIVAGMILGGLALIAVSAGISQTANNNIQSQPVAITNAGQAGTIAAVKASAAPVASDGAVAVSLSPNNAGGPTLANFPTSATLTARNVFGGIVAEKSSRWSVVSNPASGSQATASIAAEAAVRHVADCINFSTIASGATAATNLTINLRDGATGAGTIIWTYQTGAPILAAGGTMAVPHSICGLNLVGTTNTAMTFEFSAGLTGLIEAVSISGYNVN